MNKNQLKAEQQFMGSFSCSKCGGRHGMQHGDRGPERMEECLGPEHRSEPQKARDRTDDALIRAEQLLRQVRAKLYLGNFTGALNHLEKVRLANGTAADVLRGELIL